LSTIYLKAKTWAESDSLLKFDHELIVSLYQINLEHWCDMLLKTPLPDEAIPHRALDAKRGVMEQYRYGWGDARA